MQREDRKAAEEADREARKYWDERARESLKHDEEMRREAAKHREEMDNALTRMVMPVRIPAERLLGAPPLVVLLSGIPMVVAIAWLGVAVAQMASWP